MPDLEKAIRILEGNYKNFVLCHNGEQLTVNELITLLKAQEPVVHSRWHQNDNGTYSCKRCNSWIPYEQHFYARYCLYCSAKMDGGEDDA